MLIPSYAAVQQEFGVPEALLAIPDALFVLVAACFALIWGYYTDRIDRGKVIMAGAFSWTVGMLLTAFCVSYEMLLFSRMLSGAGLGCVLPVGYSILSDAIPPDERSGWFGTLAILSSVSNGIGQGLSGFIGPIMGWRFPFLVLAGISLVIIIFLFFVKIPQRGASEDELLDLAELNLEYSYRISKDDLSEISKKKTNRYLILQGFFAIIPGTIIIYFLTTMLALHYLNEVPTEIRLQTATIFAGMVGIGYILGNIFLSKLGDALYKRNKRNRARLAMVSMFITIPLILLTLLLITPVNVDNLDISYPNKIRPDETMKYTLLTVQAIFIAYPQYIYFFFVALFGSIFSSGSVANKNAVMIDVNMPEHKGTAASFLNLSEQLGKGLTLLLSFMLISMLGSIWNMMFFSVFFYIPATILWFGASKHVEADMDIKSQILSERNQISLIDYIFELEIQLDRAIQKLQDSKYYIFTNRERFQKLLNDAITLFTFCEKDGEFRSITNIEKKAHIMKLRAILVKKDTKRIFKELSRENLSARERDQLNQDLRQIKMTIDEWEKSTFGEILTFYEDGYLKIVEARLNRDRDILLTMRKIDEAIKIYHRVKHLLKERIENIEIANIQEDLKEDESIAHEKEQDLFQKCDNSLKAAVKLKEEIQNALKRLSKEGIEKEDLIKISALTAEYNIDLYKVIVDTLGKDKVTKEKIKIIIDNIDSIFNEYDKWKETDFTVF